VYTPGTILYFTPFYFKNGNRAKTKYFIVLSNNNNQIVLGSLPTRNNCIPQYHTLQQGCINDSAANFNCFVFLKDHPVTQCGKAFDFNTFVYASNLDTWEFDYLNSTYKIDGTDYLVFGQLQQEIFDDLIKCLTHAPCIKRGFRRMLQPNFRHNISAN